MFAAPTATAATAAETANQTTDVAARRNYFRGLIMEGLPPPRAAELAREILAMSAESHLRTEDFENAARFPFRELLVARRKALTERPFSAQDVIQAMRREVRVLALLQKKGLVEESLLLEAQCLLETAEHVHAAVASEEGRDVAGAFITSVAQRYGKDKAFVDETVAVLVDLLGRTVHRFNRWAR